MRVSSSALLAATNFVNQTGGMSQIVLTCLWFGFLFCVLVAMIRVAIGENKIIGGFLILSAVAVTWIGYENASEYTYTSALSLTFNLVTVKASALSTASVAQLLGGQ